MKKTRKLEAIKSTTMFLTDQDTEDYFAKLVDKSTAKLRDSMQHIDTEVGLRDFIAGNRESIKMLETVLGISGERMKRVVTMIRVGKGYTFDSEWTESKLQSELASNPGLMAEYCELFLHGRETEKYKQLIPKFILDDFFIDSNVISRVTNEDVLAKMYKAKIKTKYTSTYSHIYEKTVEDCANAALAPLGLSLEKGNIENVGKNLRYVAYGNRRIIITCNYSLTTSKGQTNYYNDRVQPVYQHIRGNNDIILVNILDGAGWLARMSDYKKVYNDCHYFLNLKTMGKLAEIAKEFFNID